MAARLFSRSCTVLANALAALMPWAGSVSAQPGPPSICFVVAEDREALRPLGREIHVMQFYRERIPYVGLAGSWLGPWEALTLEGGRLFMDSTRTWEVFHLLEGMAESFMLITAGMDTMRMDLTEDPALLWHQAMGRGNYDTPEVVRFRKGRFDLEALVTDSWSVRAAQQLAARVAAEREADYEHSMAEQARQERIREREQAAAANKPPQPPPTQVEIEEEIARRPGLKELAIKRVDADSVWLRISGRVMLDGGCASGMPLFGLEMRLDAGWVERVPMRMVQMDCGMPWADWTERIVELPPLRWWVAANQPEASEHLEPGTYRLVLMGANMKQLRTGAFELR